MNSGTVRALWQNERTAEWRRVSPHIHNYNLWVCALGHTYLTIQITWWILILWTSQNLPTFTNSAEHKIGLLRQERENVVFYGSRVNALSSLKRVHQFKKNKSRHGAYRDPRLFTVNCNSHRRDIAQLILQNKMWDMGPLVCYLLTFLLYILITFQFLLSDVMLINAT